MALNQLVTDLKVKSVTVKKKVGNSWVRPPESHFISGVQYKLELVFGNANGMISYTDEQFRKDNVDIRVCGMGFKVGSLFVERTKLVFYTNSTFTTQVSGGDKTRTSYFFPTYQTVYADSLLNFYFKMAAGVSTKTITSFSWDMGIYASVRNRVWRKILSQV